jgi:riboflavin kinase/FMN adenylyltransferase
MKIIRGIHNICTDNEQRAIAIGNFDGVHLGHQNLLAKTVNFAREHQIPACVVTFEPHPMEYFLKDQAAPRLMRLREKLITLARYGVDEVLIIYFRKELIDLTAEAFIQSILVEKLRAKHIIVGDNFQFGKNRAGKISDLIQAGKQFDFTVDAIPQVMLDERRVSSSWVREALAKGDQGLAERLLGCPYSIMGQVAHGDKRGRILGFPTANIYLHRAVTPVQGVYAVKTTGIGGQAILGVANVGIRPTVGGTRSLLEVHLFDFNQDIYGKHVCVEFCQKLRGEKRFDSLDLLKEAIFADAQEARNYFREL